MLSVGDVSDLENALLNLIKVTEGTNQDDPVRLSGQSGIRFS